MIKALLLRDYCAQIFALNNNKKKTDVRGAEDTETRK